MTVSLRQPLTLYTSAARTATPTAAEFDAQSAIGLHLVIDVTASSGTPSVVPTIAFQDTLSGKWITLLTGSAITGTGTTTLKILPGVTVSANVAVSDAIHGHMRLVMTHGEGSSITYSAGAHFIT